MNNFFELRRTVTLVTAVVLSSVGCKELAEQEAENKPGKIVFVDEDGVPFSNFNFAFKSDPKKFITTNSKGEYDEKVGVLKKGLDEEWWWYPMQDYGNDFIGWGHYTQPSTVKVSAEGTYTVTFKRVLFSDGMGDTESIRKSNGYFCWTGQADCFSVTTVYLAQAFIPPEDMQICHVGIGQHGGDPNGYRFLVRAGIYSNNAGSPGVSIASNDIIIPYADRKSASSGPSMIADLCEGGAPKIHLSAGVTYWVVGQQDSALGNNPNLPNYMGSTRAPASGLPMKHSSDGVTWIDLLTLRGGVKSLHILVAQ